MSRIPRSVLASACVAALATRTAHGAILLGMSSQYHANTDNVIDDYESSADPAYTGGPVLAHSLGHGTVTAVIDATVGSMKLQAADETQGSGGAVAALIDQLTIVGATGATATITIHAGIDRALQLEAAPMFPQDEGDIADSRVKFEVYPFDVSDCAGNPGSCCQDCDGTGGQLVDARLEIDGPLSMGGAAGLRHFVQYKGDWQNSTDEGPGFPPGILTSHTDDVTLVVPGVPTDEGIGLFARLLVDARCGTTAGVCRWGADASHSVYLEVTSSDGVVTSQNGYHYLGRAGASSTTTTLPGGGTTTTTLPACITARCLLDGALQSGDCAGQSVPGKITHKLSQAETVIEASAEQTAKKARRSRAHARVILNAAGAAARHAAKGKHPKLSAACAQAIDAAITTVEGDLGK